MKHDVFTSENAAVRIREKSDCSLTRYAKVL